MTQDVVARTQVSDSVITKAPQAHRPILKASAFGKIALIP